MHGEASWDVSACGPWPAASGSDVSPLNPLFVLGRNACYGIVSIVYCLLGLDTAGDWGFLIVYVLSEC
jgi:hypothetical protein